MQQMQSLGADGLPWGCGSVSLLGVFKGRLWVKNGYPFGDEKTLNFALVMFSQGALAGYSLE